MTPLPFITTQDLVDYIGRGGTADAGIIMAVDAACDTCRTVASQLFNAGTVTEVLNGTGGDALLLSNLPVNAAGTVVVNGGTVTDYALDGNGILFRRSTTTTDSGNTWQTLNWPEGRQNIRVTYSYGYESTDMPRDVRMVALALAARLVIQGPALQEQVGETSVRYAVASTELTRTERMILEAHGRGR